MKKDQNNYVRFNIYLLSGDSEKGGDRLLYLSLYFPKIKTHHDKTTFILN